jgi:hypothetical protein
MADETVSTAPVKMVPLEEIGIVSAVSGGVAVVAGSILLGVGLDAARWRHYPAGQIADEVVIAGVIMASGAVALGVGIPLALVGKAQRERASAFVVPTFGGAAVVGRF